MSRYLNTHSIINSAKNSSNTPDEFSTALEGTPFAEAVQAAKNKKREAEREALTDDILAILEASNAHTEQKVAEIRSLRAKEAAAKKSLSDRDRALAYGLNTGNLLPIAILLGKVCTHTAICTLGEDFAKLSKVPEDWVAPVVAPKSE